MKTTILVAEDNESLFIRYQEIIAKDESFELVGYAKDGQTALERFYNKCWGVKTPTLFF